MVSAVFEIIAESLQTEHHLIPSANQRRYCSAQNPIFVAIMGDQRQQEKIELPRKKPQ